jgi:hypothetical protein
MSTSFLYLEYRWEKVAFAAANVCIEAGPPGLITIRVHPDAPLKTGRDRTGDFGAQIHELAGVGQKDGWHRAGLAQGTDPARPYQAAFLAVAAAEIIPIEIFTIETGGCFHGFSKRQRTNGENWEPPAVRPPSNWNGKFIHG